MKASVKTVLTLLLAAVMLLALAACGSSAPAPAPANDGSAAPAPAETKAPEPTVNVDDLNTTKDTEVSGETTEAAAKDPNVTFKCGLTFTLDDYRGEDLQWWADRVHELSGGSITIELYPSETLVKGTESVPAMVMGTIDMYLVTPSYVSGIVDGINALEMPCTAPTKQLSQRLQLCYDVMVACEDKIMDAFDKAGIKFIGTLCQGGYVDMVYSKPIHSAAEYTNLKVRTTGGLNDDVLKALGCTPTFISSSDLYLSLQTGVVDGAMTTPTTILNNKLYELCPYMVVPSLSNAYSPYFVCCSNDVWNAMSENQQEIVVKAAYECLARTIEIYPERQSKDREVVKGLLTEYIELTDEDWAQMMEKIDPVYQSYVDQFSPAGKEIYAIKRSIEDAWKG